MEEQEFCIDIDEWVEARIWEKGVLRSTQWFKGNTVLAKGRYELAMLLTDQVGYEVDKIYAVVGSTITKEPNMSRSDNTLSLETGTPYTVAGTYSAIMTGSSSFGPSDPYNSIGVSIVLTPGSELDFTIRWVFTGDAGGFSGGKICAARFGAMTGPYDYPLGSVAVFMGASIKDVQSATFRVLSNGTFYVGHGTGFDGPSTFDNIQFITTNTGAERFFDKIDGFTVTTYAGQTVDTLTEIELG